MSAEPFSSNQPKGPPTPPPLSGLARIWDDLVKAGWGEHVLRYATHALLLAGLVAALFARQVNLGFFDALADKASLSAGAQTTAVTGIAGPATPTPDPLGGDT